MWENLFEPKAYLKKCKICGADFISYSWCGCYCSEKCRKIGNRESKQKYYDNHKDDPIFKKLKNERQRKNYRKNPKKQIESSLRWKKNNLERWRDYWKKYYKKNRELLNLNKRINYFDKCWRQYYEI